MVLTEIANALTDTFAPSTCLGCGALVEEDVVCRDCRALLVPASTRFCLLCNRDLSSTGKNLRCLRCAGLKSSCRSILAAFEYGGLVRERILAMKHGNRRDLAAGLGRLLATELSSRVPDEITRVVPVPLHVTRLTARGYNQAAFLGREIARVLEAPLDLKLLKRIRATPPTRGMTRKTRQKLVNGAFRCLGKADLSSEIVLLVDDVGTTLSTLQECSRTLQDAGVREIHAVLLARPSSSLQ